MPTEPLRYEHYEVQTDESGSPLRLGAGGMGTTYRAFDTRLKRVVALKIINNSLLATQESKRRFLNEARAAALLDHPNIARVFHVSDETAQECFFTMELVEGESLGSRVTRYGPLPAGEALLTLRPIAEALGALAERSLVHRDLKPDNIMLVRTGGGGARVKLIDFGLAKSLDGESAHFQNMNTVGFVGSVYFASPEQIRHRPGTRLDARSDFYSLGATLWAALSGFPPFTGTVFEVQEGHVYNDPPWEKISPLPPPLRHLLTCLLAKDPDARPADATALLAEWDAAIEGLREYPTQAALVPEADAPVEDQPTLLHGREASGVEENETPQPEEADIVEPPELAPPPVVKTAPTPQVAPTPRLPKKPRGPALAIAAIIILATAALAGWWFGIKQPRKQGANYNSERDQGFSQNSEREQESTLRVEAEAATALAEKKLATQQEAQRQIIEDAAKMGEKEIARARQAEVDLATKPVVAGAAKPAPTPPSAVPPTSPRMEVKSSRAQTILELLNSKAMYSAFDYYGITPRGRLVYNFNSEKSDEKNYDDLTVFDLKTKTIKKTFLPFGNAISIAADGSLFAGHTMSLDNEIQIVTEDNLLFTRAFDEYIQSSAFSPDSKLLAVVCLYSIHVLDIQSRKVIASVKSVHELGASCFSSDGRTLIVGDTESNQVLILDVRTKKMSRIKFPEEGLRAIWRVADTDKIFLQGNTHFYHLEPSKMQLKAVITHPTYPLDLSESGKYAGIAGHNNGGSIVVFDMLSGSPVFTLKDPNLRLGIVLDDGVIIAENEKTKTYEAHAWK